MSEIKTQVRTKAPWCWMSEFVLVGNHGHRPVVLMSSRGKAKLSQCGPDGIIVDADPKHPDMRLIAGSARLIEAVEAFMRLRPTIFPAVNGAQECAALQELEEAVKAAGGEVPYGS